MEWFADFITRLLAKLFPKKPSAADQKIVDQQESLATGQRVREAEAGPRGSEVTQDRLDKRTY